MNITQATIQRVLNAMDIESLLKLGAPDDEYKTEAEMIAAAVKQNELELTEEHLITIVQNVWVKMFGPFSEEQIQMRYDVFRQVARNILIVGGPRI